MDPEGLPARDACESTAVLYRFVVLDLTETPPSVLTSAAYGAGSTRISGEAFARRASARYPVTSKMFCRLGISGRSMFF
jgi:hypothetical protein